MNHSFVKLLRNNALKQVLDCFYQELNWIRMITLAVFMLETLKLSKTLKSSRDDFNVLDNFTVSSINASIGFFSHLHNEI